MSEKECKCSFCGKSQKEANKMIASPNGEAFICDECIEICKDIVIEYTPKSKFEKIELPAPSEIKAKLDDYIIGQENAKRAMAVAVYNHYKRVNYNLVRSVRNRKVELDKSNILLIGPTGVGKTLIAKTLARMLKVPFACVDATTLTEAGYVGEDVESVLSKLLRAADGDVMRAETGIIYIDEVDKIAKKADGRTFTRDVSGEGVQQALLKMLEGTVVQVPQGAKRFPGQETVSIDTSNILFICGGAFVRLKEIVEKRKKVHSLGFGSNMAKKVEENHEYRYIDSVEPADLIDFGLIPEFIGRLPVVIGLEPLDQKSMINILTTPKNNLIDQFKTIFKLDGIELKFDTDALAAIADKAAALNIGARGLRTIMEEIMLDAMFTCPSEQNLERVTITADCVKNNAKPHLQYKKAEKIANI